MTRGHQNRGFTLVEVSIILLVLTILSTIMLPQLGNFNRLARFVKAREDVGALCSSMKKMLDEVMLGAFFVDPRPNGDGKMPVGLLVGPGREPAPGSAHQGPDGWKNGGTWLLQPGERFTVPTDNAWRGMKLEFVVDKMQNHLQQNNPLGGYRWAAPYKNPIDNPERWAAGAFFGWRGPYLDELTADPWGTRYMANVFALYKHPKSDANDDIYTSAVVCYSAGIDSGVDTVFNQPSTDADGDGMFGWKFGDDDIGAVLSAGGPF